MTKPVYEQMVDGVLGDSEVGSFLKSPVAKAMVASVLFDKIDGEFDLSKQMSKGNNGGGVTGGFGITEEIVDATDDVEVYDEGKVMECKCGQRIGVAHNLESTRCASCGSIIVDEDWDSREEEAEEGVQSELDEFI